MDTVDGYLSRRLQTRPRYRQALVLQTETGQYILRVPAEPDLGLGDQESEARLAIEALLRAEFAREQSD